MLRPRPGCAVLALYCASAIALGDPGLADARAADDPLPRASTEELKSMSVEALLDLEVTTASKRPEKLSDTAAAIQVITHEDIRRAGATSLPEALRLASNLQVARIGVTQYAVSARGFNNAIGNKLLVLIDGRTVYTPLFSGVFWDQQDLLLEDIERIEVISGPGATLWGANAVNGVINIITWPAGDTQGVLVGLGGGHDERSASLRFGGGIGGSDGDGGHFRVYAKGSELDNMRTASGAELRNGWERVQGGFRADWRTSWRGADGTFTLQGDAYDGASEHRGFVGAIEVTPVEVSGANLLARWGAELAGGSDVRVQAYLDHAERDDVVLFRPTSDIFDIEFQQGLQRGAHELLWGASYRHARDEVEPGLLFTFNPSAQKLDWGSVFVRDRLALSETLELTAGLKVEHNDYTGFEYLPSVHLAWKLSEAQLLWGSVSRAVRAPARLDREVFFPVNPPFLIAGGPSFDSEVARVVEIGYRAQRARLSWSATLFYHDWKKLRSGQMPPGIIENRIEGAVYGAEAWANWQVGDRWTLSGGVTGLREELRLEEGSTDPVGVRNPNLANDPEYQWTLRSSWRIAAAHDLDVHVYRVDDLPNPPVSDYTAVNARYAWRIRPNLELSVVGVNLFDPDHVEFGAAATASAVERAVHGKLLWEF